MKRLALKLRQRGRFRPKAVVLSVAVLVLIASFSAAYVYRQEQAKLRAQVAEQAQRLAKELESGLLGHAEQLITHLDLEEAVRLLARLSGPQVMLTRARLSIYLADCETAASLLSASAVQKQKGAPEMLAYAERCSRATLGGIVVEDAAQGIRIRLQDEADTVLVPLIVEAATMARTTIEQDLGTELPRPMRIDLVRDLFSLSAVSGLPVDAAETTGTVAVARFGRVTMLSPRAMQRGYGWRDTLAHEITHLVLSRGSLDRAPLWLQEGVAKREETRYRALHPWEKSPNPSQEAYQAARSGRSVGVDRLGPSIAMLPSADAASVAFAEVTSFVEFLLAECGSDALKALIRDVAILPDVESALRSSTGLGLVEWQWLWRQDLDRRFEARESTADEPASPPGLHAFQRSRTERLVELLFHGGHFAEARELGFPPIAEAPHAASLRFLVARAAQLSGHDDVELILGEPKEMGASHGGYLALVGRAIGARQPGEPLPALEEGPASVSRRAEGYDAAELQHHALGLDPLLPEVACRGEVAATQGTPQPKQADPLCAHTRSLPVRGAE